MKGLLAALLLSAAPAAAVPASESIGKRRFGLEPGPALVVGDAADRFKHSFSFQGSFEAPPPRSWEAPPWLRLGLEVGHSPRHVSKQQPDLALRVLEICPYARASAWWEETEFAGHLGLGYYRTWSREALVSGARYTVPTRNHVGMNVGGSVTQWHEDRFGISLDVRYHQLFYRDGEFQYLIPSLRLLYAF